jgi:murein DD-endopeptidase MepM/ murein hydrolase activator NlpD
MFHYGTDVAVPKGTKIVAFAEGTVIAAGESETLGKYVIISHGSVESEYGHCSDVCVKSGQSVRMGERIATAGDTGNATESCLHFELKVSGQNVNPAYYIGEWQ